MEGVIGYVTMFAGNFAPMNWAFCQGQTVNINTNTALFSIVGTYYGGNGTNTFMLPDLRGRSVIGAGQNYSLGENGGANAATLNLAQMPVHTHPVTVTTILGADDVGSGQLPSPANNVYSLDSNGQAGYAAAAQSNTYMQQYNGTIAMGSTGTGTSFNLASPYLGLNYIICCYGIYPARN